MSYSPISPDAAKKLELFKRTKNTKMSELREKLKSQGKRYSDAMQNEFIKCAKYKNKAGEDIGEYCHDNNGNITLVRTTEEFCTNRNGDDIADYCIFKSEKK